MQINGVEAIWLLSCAAGILVTGALLLDAIQERHAYIKSGANGRIRARLLVLNGTVRRDALRLFVQLMLLTAVVPGLLQAGEVTLGLATPLEAARTIAVVSLMLVPVLLLTSSLGDARDRRRLKAVSEEIVKTERETIDAALMTAIHDVGEKAEAAYHEANSVNIKIANLDQRLVEQGARADAEIARTDTHQDKQDGRIEAVEGA